MSTALLRLLRADADVGEAWIERERLVVRMRRHATADAWPRVDRLIGGYVKPRKSRRRRAA